MTKQFWMVKSEPAAYSWEKFVADQGTTWTGVRNFQARNHLRAMKKGDPVLFYHSVTGKEVVGLAKVAKEAYPDATAKDGDWSCVDLVPSKALKIPVTLEQIKATPKLKDISLLRQSRLSVMSLKPEEFEIIVQISEGK